ncbi:CDP-diacylglycerol--serine O-phosphatidyltransferase [Rhodobaculum claviforme]|uniref:CDP-diacylglycerol--serine O-phosphatidyltransferase n=1 Tax=Rhodobaculum claviforme TaxID=1549854 RepID=A0A934WI68_9RHOB|nr:CDP-diacylglycerol--serine O-phosphatidyltransferase [Rhodobaculum claviforme]MBK5926248.1 CDP-diacylglycerol--serine O-phosphatidyltransferase [Rhodobaculum claviforme]
MRRPLHRLAPRPRRSLPLFHLLPNLVTILGLCAGLTAIRFALVERWEIAVGLILFAAVIDGLDGLIARRLDAASPFGAELDSLSDFVNFGVAPAVVVYGFALQAIGDAGWVFALVFAIGCCLRLARFNVGRAEPEAPARTHFTGVPAPAGALLGLLPVYLSLGGVWATETMPWAIAVWLGLVGALMVSRLATLSPKALRIPRERAVWVLLLLALLVGVAFTQFWVLMTLASLAYSGTLVYAAVRRHPPGRG